MDALVACWVAAASLIALAALGGGVWALRSSRREPHSFDGFAFAAFFMLGMAALIALAAGLGRTGGPWAAVGILGVNGLVQPGCLYLFAAGAYKLGMALVGRVVYAWRIVPRAEVTSAEHRAMRWYCASQGLVAFLLASGLGWVCLQPLL
jgi:hypothetical protein